MKILLLCHSFNSLTQRLHCDLRAAGHEVSVEFDINDAVTEEAVELFQPDLVIAPFLKRAIPASVFEKVTCLIVHPGPPGDRGPSSLDWAVLEGAAEWGVTVLQAEAELDAGPVWASRTFPMRAASKASLYRRDVTEAACDAVFEALEKFNRSDAPERLDRSLLGWRPSARQTDRAIDWTCDTSEMVLRKIRSADGMPGLKDRVFEEAAFLFDARPDRTGLTSSSQPGSVIARSGPALALKTVDGAIWVGHVRKADEDAIKLPATHVFAEGSAFLPEIPDGYQDIRFEEIDGAGYLHFDFYNGAMGTNACRRLTAAFEAAAASDAKVLVLTGGADHWSNGLNLNLIEAADSPAEESWENIQAIDDLAEAIIRTTDKWIIAALGGGAGAGGVFLARAADEVWLRPGTILNPHYKDMGNLYGSEFWTYLLPKYSGSGKAALITQARLPMGAVEALELGLADRVLDMDDRTFAEAVAATAASLAQEDLASRLATKAGQRAREEAEKPLAAYRAAELERMRKNFYGFDPSYHVARYNFVRKIPKSRTPLTLAHHRAGTGADGFARRAAS